MKISFAIAIAFVCVAAFATTASAKKTKWHQLENYSFDAYLKEYGKSYSSEEYKIRKQRFDEKLAEIKKHNKDSTKTWKMGVNQLTDLHPEEFNKMLGYKRSEVVHDSNIRRVQEPSNVSWEQLNLPKSWDWREAGVVTAVKDQGMCGSCWSFGTAESVESAFAIATGKLAVLSEQMILDCVPNPNHCGGTGGCEGGTPELAYAKLIQLGGLASEWTYPYISYFGTDYTCKYNVSNTPAVAKLTSYTVLPSNQYTPVLQALATVGPLAINVDASSWSSYETGVYNGCSYSNVDIDHVVLLVGYGTDEANGDYWLVRNSWSPLWGEEGYIRIKRDSNPICGTDYEPQDGTGCNGGPAQVTTCGACGILYDVSYPNVQ